MSPKISIIIVTYNSGPLTYLCLWSLQRASLQHSEVIVVDNAGSDDIPKTLLQHFPFIKLLKNEVNEGFGRACNLGMRQAEGQFLLMLNPDTIVPENFEAHILRFFENHPAAGAMGVKMISGHGDYLPESKRNLPTPVASICRFTGLAHLFPHSTRFARYYAGHLPHSQAGTIEVLSGAFMVVTRQAIEKSGAFDPRFFLYGEDIDLSWRIHQAGFQVWYNPALTIIHFKGESTPKNLHHAKIFYGAMHLFYRKHFNERYHRLVSLGALATIRVLALLAAGKHFFTGRFPGKIPAQFCLHKTSCSVAATHLKNRIPFEFVLPENCHHSKIPPALLINTRFTGPSQLIEKARQCHHEGLQLFIWHPPTGHLFMIAGKNSQSRWFITNQKPACR